MADSIKIKLTGDDREFRNTLAGAGQAANNVFKGIMASQIVTKGISMLANGLKSAINTGMQFEAAMSQVAAISGATGAELELLTETAKRYGETTMFSASQAAEALNYMALAGWDAQQSVDALGGVLDLAAASGMDLGAASDAVTDYLSAFGMEASQAGYMADLMAYAQSRSNTTANMLADAYGNCASSMHAAGQDIETTTAMLMALANQGIKGSEAGTQMSAVMRDLTSKMENGKIMIGKTAVTVADSAGNFRDLNDILVDVGKATEGMGTAEQSAAIMETFTARSVKAIQTILNEGVQNVNDYEAALRGSEGTAAEQAEKMMDNLQGDIKIFQSALEGVQITASESMNGTARSIVQEGTAVLDAINQAGKTDGLAGMADAAIAQIPSLLPKVVSGVERLLKGVGGRLPGLMKGLFASLPDLLGAGGELVPTLIESLTDAGGAAIEGLIGNLPNMLPALFAGIGKGILGAGNGVLNLVESVFTGVDQALLRAGMRKMRLDEVIQSQLDNVDMEHVRELTSYIENNVSVNTEVTVDDVEAKLEEAKATIRAKIANVEGIDPDELANAIISGDSTNVLTEALKAVGISGTDAARVATTITKAQNTIQTAINGLSDLGLTEEQTTTVSGMAAEGASESEIVTYLRSCGVPDGVASEVAGTITGANTEITGALSSLPADVQTALGGLSGMDAKTTIEAALKLLKLSPTDYNDVIKSYRVAGTLLSSSVGSVFDKIGQKLTDGVPDSAEDIAGLKAAVTAWAKDAYEKIDQWYEEELEALNGSGKTGEEYDAAVDELKQKAEELKSSVEASAAGANAFIDEMGGKATSYVQEHLGELQGLKEEAQTLAAEIDALSLSSEQKHSMNVSRNLVIGGLSNDTKTQTDAIAITATERAEAIEEANEKYSAAIERLKEALDAGEITPEAYSAAEADVLSTREQAIQEAEARYDATMKQVIDGIVSANPELKSALDQYAQDKDIADSATKIFDTLNSAMSEAGAAAARGDTSFSLEDYFANSGLTDSDYAKVADSLGLTPDQLWNAIDTSFKNNDASGLTSNELWGTIINPEQGLASALEGIDMSGAGAVLMSALQKGLLTDGGEIDWTNLGEVLKMGISDVAENIPAGLVEKMSDTSGVEAAGTALGQAGVDSVAVGAQTQSPSAATRETGQNVVAGLVEGMGETGSVTAAGNALGQAAVNGTQASMKGGGSIGQQFAHGLAYGILSGRSNVIAAAISVANAAAAAARAALQIHSPSKVTEGFGRMFDQGFVVGIDREAGSVVRSAVSLVNNVVGAANLAPKMDLSGMQSALNGAMTDFTDAEAQRDIVLRLNGRDVARVTAPDNNKALNHYSKQVALGYGRG